MPIPTKPNEQRIRHDGDFTWELFAKNCVLNKYAIVIGNETVLNRTTNVYAEGNSLKLIFDLAINQLAQNSNAVDKSAEYERLKCRYKDFWELFRESPYDKIKVKESVRNAIINNDFYTVFDNEIEPTLMRLLQTKCFRMVLTTSIDPYVEIAMEKIWGKDGFDVVQMENANQLFKNKVYDEFGIMRPTLCYIFGKVDKYKPLSENRFVLSENDAMEKISGWFETKKNNSFLNYLRNFRMLSVGAKLDDWMFRFFWFLLRGRVGTEADGQVAVEIKDDDNLKKYLEHEKVKVFANARSFMMEAAEKIEFATDIGQLPRKENGVFISYAHEDKYIALPLFERLNTEGVNVWIDEENLKCGDIYNPRIEKVVRQCKVFMPILSSQVKQDLVTDTDRWYMKEWNMAQSRVNEKDNINSIVDNFEIIPVIVGDYKVNEKYHNNVPPCIHERTAFEMAKDDVKYLIEKINKYIA